MSAVETFWRLCADCQHAWERGLKADSNAGDCEPQLLILLEFVKRSPSAREQLGKCFVDLVEGRRRAPNDVLVFCMRELRWPEVKAAAERQLISADWKLKPLLVNIIEVYSPVWQDADLYEYYRKREQRA